LPRTRLSRKCSQRLPEAKRLRAKTKKPFRQKAIVLAGMTEAEVIAKAQAGNVECFEAPYARHKQRVFFLCLQMTGNYAQAEDLTQEIFLQLYRKIASFRGESAFSTWLHRLSVNRVLMNFRKKCLAEVSLEQVLESLEDYRPTKDIGVRDNFLQGAIDRITLEQSLRWLPHGYRTTLVLHDIEGYQHSEIARILGCSIGNSKSQLHRARMKLRTLLPAHGEMAVDRLAA
jgi:RNA polymerase sigma-70 factor, ECF subfamily